MRIRIRSPEDFWAGLMFVGFGLTAIIISRDYPMGSAMRMGPGYFPTWLGILMMALGAVMAIRSTKVQGEGISGWTWRPLIMLSAAFVAYGLAMGHFELGFVPSLVLVIVVSSLAGNEFHPVELVLLTLVLLALTVGLFIYGLELPYPLFWWSW